MKMYVEQISALVQAELGDAEAQYLTGVSYEEGDGVPQDYDAARHWYLLAATQDNGAAQDSIAGFYGKRLGVDADHKEAFRWWCWAANQGFADAGATLA